MNENNDNLLIEVLDDGTEVVIDLDVCDAVADSIIDNLFSLAEDNEVENFDPIVTCFSLFIDTYHILLNSGWTVDGLKNELDEHFNTHKKTMN
jgi:hypothetical protein